MSSAVPPTQSAARGKGGIESFVPAQGRRHALAPARRADGRTRRVLVVDNYDSFTFNLVQYLLELGAEVDVVRNDVCSVEALRSHIEDHDVTHLLMSPGPGQPADSGVCQALSVAVCDDLDLPTLGVCLGHQTLCAMHGASVVRAGRIMHGKLSPMIHDGAGVFEGLPSPYDATRYHSLIVEPETLPETLLAVAHTPEGELMAVRHRSRPVYGVQFHPESILSAHGHALLVNFLRAPAGAHAEPSPGSAA